MQGQRSREAILGDIAAITTMERGKICEMHRASGATYYNLQRWTGQKNRCEYVRARDLPAVREAVANHAKFRELVEEYATVVERCTRQARRGSGSGEKGGSAKRLPRRQRGR